MRRRLLAIVSLLLLTGYAGAAAASAPRRSSSSAVRAGVWTAAQAHTASSGPITGLWTGRVTQRGHGAYEVLMAVKPSAGTLIGRTAYPSLDCEGNLALRAAHGNSYVFREQIYFGGTRCSSGGTISVTVSGNSMSWRWAENGTQVVGVLHRAGTRVTITGSVRATLTALPRQCSTSGAVRTIQIDGTDSQGATVTLTVTDQQKGGSGQLFVGAKLYAYHGEGRLTVTAAGASFSHVVMPENDGSGHGAVTINGHVSC